MNKEAQPFEKPQPDATEPATKEPEPELTTDEVPAAEKAEKPEPESEPPPVEPETDEAPQPEANEPMDELESESEPPPEPIPDNILNTVRAVMGAFTESRPNDYVARLEASPSEWMTITDDSLSNELERELLTSAAAMCLWQELMILVSGRKCQQLHRRLRKDRPSFCPWASWPVEYCVKAQIDTETLKSIVVRSRSVLTSPDLLEGRLRGAGTQLLAGSSQVEQSG